MARTRLIVATGNRHKVEELSAQLGEFFVVEGLPEGYDPPAEDGMSFAANAKIKAQSAAARLGCLCLADDSGICVDALDGAPGIHSARFAGAGASDQANNQKLLAALADLEPTQRSARFVCALSLATPEGEIAAFQGVFEGVIAAAPRGAAGFGYDPLFITADGRTAAQLSGAEKRARSHRGAAVAALLTALKEGSITI
jgi:XTP/dITP diphosphohydrolase